MSTSSRKFVVCSLDNRLFAVELHKVERVVRAVEITHVPEAPPSILGVIKVKESVIPVVNARRRFGLPNREIELNDVMVLANVSHGYVALLVDEVTGIIECGEESIVPANKILHDMHAIEGVAKTTDGLVIVEDLERFLSNEEAAALLHTNEPVPTDS